MIVEDASEVRELDVDEVSVDEATEKDAVEDATEDIDIVDMITEELELSGGAFVYKFSLSGPPQYSV